MNTIPETKTTDHTPTGWPSNQTIEETDADLRSQIESFIEDATEEDRHFLNEAFYVRERSYQGHKLGLAEAMGEILGIDPEDFRHMKAKRLNEAATDLHRQFNSIEGFKQFESQALNLVNALCWLSPSARRMAATSVAMNEPQLLIDVLAYASNKGHVNMDLEEPKEEPEEDPDADIDGLVEEALGPEQ